MRAHLLLALTVFFGCSDPEEKSDTGIVETEADTDTDTDTGADSTGGYTGSFELVLTEVAERKIKLDDTCTGTADITVSDTETPVLTGEGRCQFEGMLAAIGFLDEYGGSIDGAVTTDPFVEGNVTLNVMGVALEEPWVGRFSGNNLNGSFSGRFVYTDAKLGKLTFDYVGTFNTSK